MKKRDDLLTAALPAGLSLELPTGKPTEPGFYQLGGDLVRVYRDGADSLRVQYYGTDFEDAVDTLQNAEWRGPIVVHAAPVGLLELAEVGRDTYHAGEDIGPIALSIHRGKWLAVAAAIVRAIGGGRHGA